MRGKRTSRNPLVIALMRTETSSMGAEGSLKKSYVLKYLVFRNYISCMSIKTQIFAKPRDRVRAGHHLSILGRMKEYRR